MMSDLLIYLTEDLFLQAVHISDSFIFHLQKYLLLPVRLSVSHIQYLSSIRVDKENLGEKSGENRDWEY